LNFKKLIALVAVVGAIIAAIVSYYIYNKAFSANTTFNQNEVIVYVPSDSNYEQVKEILAPFVKDLDKFDFVAQKRNYATNVKAGKFMLTKGMNAFDMVRAMR